MRELAQQIIDHFPGHPALANRAMLGIEAGTLLMECVNKSSGDYIEIGSAVGGSAIMAGVAMSGRTGNIFCIDPFGGNSELDGPDVVLQSFWDNIIQCGLQQRVIAFKQYNPPFPMPIWYHTFSIGLIDGCHDAGAPLADFKQLDRRVTRYLLFDNAEKKAVLNAINKATQDNNNWEEYKSVEYESNWEKDKMVKFVALRRKS